MSSTVSTSKETPAQRHQRIRTEGHRETVESIVVAIVLALLFRAFVAEAFVIPTGSMAPALMGAHKDLVCPECGCPYQVGASIEQKATPQINTVVATVCPNCRHGNRLDLANNPNDATFAGDRILVSKFVYALADPRRWDVIVFKYPGNPKQNYIKRLVGLPNETLQIRFGDIFSRPVTSTQFTILRKPPEKLLAMSHAVHDTAYQPDVLVSAGYPDHWQPWDFGAQSPPQDSWQVSRDEGGWKATLASGSEEVRWLRYFPRWPDADQWQSARDGQSLSNVDPYSSRAITDFYPYDSYVYIGTDDVYRRPPGILPANAGPIDRILARFRTPPGEFQPSFVDRSDSALNNYIEAATTQDSDGNHWVGDLILEGDLESEGDSGQIVLELIESAISFRCVIDLAEGTAELQIVDANGPVAFTDAGGTATSNPKADVGIYGGQRHRVRFANCDDRLYLWVDGDVIEFDQSTDFAMLALRSLDEQRPYTRPEHPYDAAPAAIGARAAQLTVHQLKILRDKYYIATQASAGGIIDDYDRRKLSASAMSNLAKTLADPSKWDDLTAWGARRTVQFSLDEDQYFPMGDNSPESLDARCWVDSSGRRFYQSRNVDPDAYTWADANYVPRDLLVGKALMVFWPHTWNSPIPFTPNVKRIGFIR